MMTLQKAMLSPAELITLQLRGLFERYGYRKYKVSQFEEYSFYLDFRSFLSEGRILSFTDLDGRLLALKPDVTLSLAKNVRMDDGARKLYYIENVYRESLASGMMKEISQMGLECIGYSSGYAQAEVLSLAAETLGMTGTRFVLDISHMGYLQALFEELAIEGEHRVSILKALQSKSPHMIQMSAAEAGIREPGVAVLAQLSSLSGPFESTVSTASDLCLNQKMSLALDELRKIARDSGCMGSLHLDFTQQADLEYYDGLLMSGYLEGVPRAVLSGGRYDGLMKKLGKDVHACGFALYLDELDWLTDRNSEMGTDVLLLDEGADAGVLLDNVKRFAGEGKRVRVEREMPRNGKFGAVYRLTREGVLTC